MLYWRRKSAYGMYEDGQVPMSVVAVLETFQDGADERFVV